MSEAFLLGRGSGPEISVRGGAEAPTDPAEDMIWVETEEAIHRWDFSSETPLRESRGENLIVYPYENGSKTVSGISFTDTGDGRITVSGTASADAVFYLSDFDTATEFRLDPGDYTLSGCPAGGGEGSYVLLLRVMDDDGVTQLSYADYGSGISFHLEKGRRARCYVKVYSGAVVGSVMFSPMLERGGEKSLFVPGSAEGQLWIQTGTQSSVPMYAFPTGSNIRLFPRICRQYSGGAWLKRTARSYQNGAWREWITYLCKNGVIDTSISGGFTAAAKAYSSTCGAGAPTVSYPGGSVSLKIAAGAYNSGIFYSKNKIDLSEVDTVTVHAKGVHAGDGYAPRFCIWSALGTYANQNLAAAAVIRTETAKDFNLNVSALSGKYYIGFFLCASGSNSASINFTTITFQ